MAIVDDMTNDNGAEADNPPERGVFRSVPCREMELHTWHPIACRLQANRRNEKGNYHLMLFSTHTDHTESDVLETLRHRIVASIMTSVDASQAVALAASVHPDGTFADVAYDDADPCSWKPFTHLVKVLTLAQRYAGLEQTSPARADLLEAAFRALDHWLDADYQCSNWFYNIIAVPGILAQIFLLFDDELTGEPREKGLEIIARAKLDMTGANQVDAANIILYRGILERDTELITRAVTAMTGEIRLTLEDGIQPDFSYHLHDALLYNHGYGALFLSRCVALANLVAGTAFQLSADKIEILCHLILDGNQWMVRYGTKDMSATGRGIARPSGNHPSAGYLAPIVRDMLKLDTGRTAELQNLLARLQGDMSVPLIGNRHFWRSDYMAHHRAAYFASVRMFSDRQYNTDWPCNGEGLKCHHLADGCTYLMRTGSEYHDIFPVWDWQRIPGTTIQRTPELTGEMHLLGTSAFVGGVSDGRYGCAAFDFARDDLFARKAWFFFDDEFICLGAGIRCTGADPVNTTLNQCFLNGEVTVSRDGIPHSLARGNHAIDQVDWIHHDGTTYLFPQPARVHLANEARTGTWHEINRAGSSEPVTHDVFTLWLDHGVSPMNACYAYIVAPTLTPADLEAYSAHSPVEILANEPHLQAVRHHGLGITGIAFYTPGTVAVAADLTLTVDQACLLMARIVGGGLEITASNPENSALQLNVQIQHADEHTVHTIPFALPEGDCAGMSISRFVAIRH